MGEEINVSWFGIGFSLALYTNALLLFLCWQRQTIRNVIIYFALFLWFSAVAITVTLFTDLVPIPSDSVGYFKIAQSISESNFDPQVIDSHIRGAWSSLGPDVFRLAEAAIVHITYPSFSLLFFGMIFLATLAVYYASRIATILYGVAAQKYVIFGFVIYFGWYWRVLQNLREAPLLLFMGVALVYYLLWWRKGELWTLFVSLVFALLSVSLRAENGILLLIIIGLTSVARNPSFVRRFWKAFVFIPVILLIGVNFVFELTPVPLKMVNVAREVSTERAGHTLSIGAASSFRELVFQLPLTLRYFLVPILPWDISLGIIYSKAYLHSLVAVVYLIVSGVGAIFFLRARNRLMRWKKPLIILLISFTAMASIYSAVDIGAGGASRHSSLYFYFLLGSFVPYGLYMLRRFADVLVQPVSRGFPSTASHIIDRRGVV